MPDTLTNSLIIKDSISSDLFGPIKPLNKEHLEQLKNSISGRFDWGSSIHLKEAPLQDGWWIFWILLALLGVVAVFRMVYPYRFQQLAETFLSARYMRQALREDLSITHPFTLMMLIQYSLCGGLLFLKSDIQWPFSILPDETFLKFLWLSSGVFLLVLIQTLVARIAQVIIGDDGGMTENRYTLIMFTEVAGILLLPLTILAWFGPREAAYTFVLAGLGILLIIYLFRIVRGVLAGLHNGTAGIYIFLYFCALELLPVLVAVRFISDQFQGG